MASDPQNSARWVPFGEGQTPISPFKAPGPDGTVVKNPTDVASAPDAAARAGCLTFVAALSIAQVTTIASSSLLPVLEYLCRDPIKVPPASIIDKVSQSWGAEEVARRKIMIKASDDGTPVAVTAVGGSYVTLMVGAEGLEPPTTSL